MASLKLTEEMILKAVKAVLQLEHGEKSGSDKKNELIETVGDVQLQISLKKIPPGEKQIKLKLPNSLKQEDMDICLFVKDLDKDERDYEPTVRHFQELLSKHGVTGISEIIPLKSLKTEYKPYEAKRNLSNAYEIFLTDARVARLLPTYLGKFFYGRKKMPIPVNLQSKQLSREIDSAVGNSICQISNKGASSLVKVATVRMGLADITANVIASVTQISEQVPGGMDNIKQLFLKTNASTSIPIYLSAGGPQDVIIIKDTSRHEVPEAEEISTLLDAKVKVYASGRIKVIKDGEEDDEPNKKKTRYSKRKTMMKKASKKKKAIFEKKGKLRKGKATNVSSGKEKIVKVKKSTSHSPKPSAKKRKLA